MSKVLTISESIEFLKRYKIKFADYTIAKGVKEAQAYVKPGKRYVLKIISPDIIHKTEARGVIVNVTHENLRHNFEAMLKNAKGRNAKILGVIVQEMIPGKEIIVGGKKDPQFGPVVLFGLGGILVEVIRDFSLRVAPISKNEARIMMTEIKGYPILKGVRGEEPVNTDGISDIIANVSKALYENQNITELDLNPVMVNPNEAVAVDARIVME